MSDYTDENSKYEKLEDEFNIHKKNFTKNSPPVYFNEKIEKLELKKIHEIESVENKPISLIAVTKNQYDTSNFLKYENYVKKLGYDRVYYGLWPDSENNKIECDVLYVIPTNDIKEIQYHLNKHNHLNHGVAQAMSLTIYSDGHSEPVNNLELK